MALNFLQHQRSDLIRGKWTTVTERSAGTGTSCWLVQLNRYEQIIGGGRHFSGRNSKSLKAQHGTRPLPWVRHSRKKFLPASRIDGSEVVEGEKAHNHLEDLQEALFSSSPNSSPLQLPEPKEAQKQQLQPQRVRRASEGGGRGGIQWILGPLALLITGAIPALWLPSHTLFAGSTTAGLLALAGLDSTFHMGATAFLLMADASARGKAPPRTPKSHSIPLGYKVWSFFVNVVGLLIPVAVVTLSIKGRLSPSLELLPVSALLGPYTLMLLVQWVAEVMVWHWNSPVWPVLPMVYQAYRLLQLTRGVELGASAAMNAPAWLVEGLLKGLVAWWVLVLGMQTMWMATLVGTMQEREQWTAGL